MAFPSLSEIPKPRAAESIISFESDADHGILVTKRYREDVPCVRWLNQHLAATYDPANGQPVGQHELAALRLLAPYGFVPKVVCSDAASIVMEFAGIPVTKAEPIATLDYRAQCLEILQTFETLEFRHNDLLPRNVLIHDGRVKIIDFTLAEFAGIEIAAHLPDPAWARMGQDAQLLEYLPRPSRWQKRLQRWFDKTRRR